MLLIDFFESIDKFEDAIIEFVYENFYKWRKDNGEV